MRNKWTETEITFLKENYEKQGSRFCAETLNRSIDSIVLKANRLRISINHKWKESEIDFLKKEYKNNGSLYCADKLNRTQQEIWHKTRNLGLKLSSEERSLLQQIYKKPLKYKVDTQQFIDIKTAEVAYILGLLWADGSIHNGKKIQRVMLDSTRPDSDYFQKLFLKTGDWRIRHYRRKEVNNKEVCQIVTSNRSLTQYLLTKNYLVKSGASALPIINSIPENLKHYWFLGLIDGDGCIYIASKKTRKCISIASVYDQNWDFMETLCNKLNISYTINLKVQKLGKSSEFLITKIQDILKFCAYIYSEYTTDKIGLERKYNKYQEIFNYLSNINKTSKNQIEYLFPQPAVE